ncbi:MAG: DNA polymerase III subunit alpha [Elusimicrobia bacterium]|nr:DNA polymerase III subunit alpha [Elusimicrobiota bacterium]
MAKADYIHLHAHSDYSLLDSCARFANDKGDPSPLLEQVVKWGMTHLALTDHGNIFGAIEFYDACKKAGVTPIIGCELYVATGSRFDRKVTASAGTPSFAASADKEDENPQRSGINHLVVLAKDNDGYKNIIELVTKASLEGFYYKPRVDKELLAQHSKGLVALSACLKGEVAQAAMSGNLQLAKERAGVLAEIFGKGNFYLELMDHGLEAQKQANKVLLEIAAAGIAGLAATNDCHYFQKEDAEAHDAMLCIGTGKKVTDRERKRYSTQEFYYKSPAEMAELFKDYPEALKNTRRIAEMCGGLEISFSEMHLPDYSVPEGFSQESYLEHLCRQGLSRRFPAGAGRTYQERLDYELSVIKQMGFPGYFLIVWDFIHFARKHGVPVGPGRGSGAGCLVSWLLDITSVNPIEYGLLFERFLNPSRRTMPDLDIDFSDEGRDQVIQYVREKYGFTNVAQIITFGTMQSRAVIRDVGRVLEVPLDEVNRIAKAIPAGLTISQAMKASQDFRLTVQQSQAAQKILPLALRLEGCRRHTGIHAAGTVITKEPVTRYAPLNKNTTSGVITSGFNDESLISLGLLKVDFLGLRTLTVIQQTIELVKERHNIDIVIDKIPYDDQKTFELFCRAQTGGVFQLESRGMRDLLLRLRPHKLTEVIALIALYRPGPMDLIPEFIRRRHGEMKIEYEHPLLEPVCRETYGILVYQEQVMQAAQVLAGYSLAEADILRRAMGKKKPEVMAKQRIVFVKGCKEKNAISADKANQMFDLLEKFAGYGFNKSHAAAYAIVAYQTAYLKANFPIEFMTALANSEIGRTAIGSEDKENKVASYLQEARQMGFATLPPSVNKSREKFSIEGDKIRFGLLAVKNVGEASAQAIVKERNKKGPFKDIEDIFKRIPKEQINRKVMESLAKAGALDECLKGPVIAQKRGQFLEDLDCLIEHFSNYDGEMLFDIGVTLPKRPGVQTQEDDVLNWERDMLGIYLTMHPLDGWRLLLKASPMSLTTDLHSAKEGSQVRLLGMAASVKRQISKKSGQTWARVRFEDLTGAVEVVVFPRTFAASSQEAFKSLQIAVADLTQQDWQRIRGILETAPEGNAVVYLIDKKPVNGSTDSLRVEFPKKIQIVKPLLEKLGPILGENNMIFTYMHPAPERMRT